MQAAAVNALMTVVTPQGAAERTGSDEPGADQAFSQLLSDSGMQSDDQGAQTPARGQIVQASAASMLAAQEMNSGTRQLLPLEAQQVTAQDAAEMIGRIDQLLASADQGGSDQRPGANGQQKPDAATLTALKEQLNTIVASGTPKTVTEIVQAMPAAKQGKPVWAVLGALFAGKAAEKSVQEDAAQNIATANAVAAVPVIPVNFFRPDRADGTAAQAAAEADSKKKKIADAVTADSITPAALPSDISAQVAAPTASGIVATPVVDLTANHPSSRRTDTDEAIPALALSDADRLPKIDLPQAGLGAPKATDVAKDTSTAADQKAINDITSLMNPSHAGGHSPTQTTHAVQPLSVAAAASVVHAAVNHAPVSDQVQVAIHKASQDGIDRITIQLDPIDLGRVEVQMHTTKEGQTHIAFTVDKPETFDTLSRDARSLERTLQEAGIKADTGSMQFNMRQQQPQQLHSDAGGQGNPRQPQPGDDDHAALTSNGTLSVASLTRNYSINIREGVDISA
ncbi:MAG: flagellar hook-length control protein FliK [Pseudomonadota bacterium]